jgi:hypothetical protein
MYVMIINFTKEITMKKNIKILFVLFSVMFASGYAIAQSSETGTTSANFLKLGAGSRVAALGGSGAAIADGADAIYWNPALLGLQNNSEVLLSYNKWIAETHNSFIGITLPTNLGTFGFGLLAFASGEMTRTEAVPGLNTPYTEGNSFWNVDGAIFISYGVDVYKNTCFGLSIKGIYQYIAEESFPGASIDLGISSKFSVNDLGFSVGFTVNNLGPKMKYDVEEVNLPVIIMFGVSVRLLEDKVLVSLSGGSVDQNTQFRFGAEYTPIEYVSLRLGYRTGLGDIKGDITGITAGLGLKYSGLKLDYAYNAYGDLGHVHIITLGIVPAFLKTEGK